jgi:ferredoxin
MHTDTKIHLSQKTNTSRYNTIQQLVQQPLIVFLRNKKLHNILVRAKQTTTTSTEQLATLFNSDKSMTTTTAARKILPKYSKKCGKTRCSTCSHFIENNKFTSTTTKQKFQIKQQYEFGCTSSNIVYLITCTKCNKQYVGKTTKTLKERITRHRSIILTKQRRYLSLHFNLPEHSLNNLKVQVIDAAETPTELDKLEQYWIHKLQTIEPKGLNCNV